MICCAGLVLPAGDVAPLPIPEVQVSSLASAVLDELRYDFPHTERASLFAGRNVMLIVPHEDDEICLFGGLFEEYVNAGSTLRVVFVTNGDAEGGDSGSVRIREAINAMAVAGIPEENVIFLGYGDQWRPKSSHIYHAGGDEPMTSYGGFTETYGTEEHPPYREGLPYTRNNLRNDLRSLLLQYRPDTIFCIDFDGHRDHRAVSLFFEEIMGELLKTDADYLPTVFKGFGYSTGWYAEMDFYAENIRSTRNPTAASYMEETNYYNWADRVRFPLAAEAMGRLKASTSVYQMLYAHASQEATTRSGGILSGDRVFWLRDTASLLYRAALSASSGNAAVLNDFKIIDTADLTVADVTFSGHVWTPDADDAEKTVSVTLPAPASLSELRLYDNPSLTANVLDAEIVFSDGSRLSTGPLEKNGAATSIRFEEKAGITGFTLRLGATEGEGAGLAELEAYTQAPGHGMHYIKLKNASDDFVYDYWIDPSGSERFSLYSLGMETPEDLAEAYTLTVEGDSPCSAAFEGGEIAVLCPAGRSLTLTIRSKADPSVADTVRISNPSSARRMLVKLMQHYEHAAGI